MKKSFVFSILVFAFSVSINTLHAKCEYLAPIEILETNIGNIMSWTTSSETNNAKFLVEKSYNGIDFEAIGEVNGAVNSQKHLKYRYLDAAMETGKCYYRVANIDTKGRKGYTPTFVTKQSQTNNFIITAMSSLKTADKISFTIRSIKATSLSYKILDDMQQKVVEKQLAVIDGANIISLNTKHLKNGAYTLVFLMGDEKEEITFNKVNAKDATNVDYVVKE